MEIARFFLPEGSHTKNLFVGGKNSDYTNTSTENVELLHQYAPTNRESDMRLATSREVAFEGLPKRLAVLMRIETNSDHRVLPDGPLEFSQGS